MVIEDSNKMVKDLRGFMGKSKKCKPEKLTATDVDYHKEEENRAGDFFRNDIEPKLGIWNHVCLKSNQ